MNPRTKNLSRKTVEDALSVCGSIYRLNAGGATGYAFTKNSNNTEVNVGWFAWPNDEISYDTCDGYIEFSSNTLQDLESNETILLPLASI